MSTHVPRAQLRDETPAAESVAVAIVPRAALFQVYKIIAVLALAVLLFYARTVAYFTFDLTIERWVQGFTPVWFDALMRFVSGLGFVPFSFILLALIILVVFVIGLRWEASMLAISAIGVGLLGSLIKLFIQRQRPTPDLVNVFSALSDYRKRRKLR